MRKIGNPDDIWRKNSLKDTKKTFPNEFVCQNGCASIVFNYLDTKHCSYYLRSDATQKEIEPIVKIIKAKRVKLKEGINVELATCPHGIGYLEVSGKDYPIDKAEHFVHLVNETSIEIHTSAELLALLKINVRHNIDLLQVRRSFGETITEKEAQYLKW